MNVPFSTAGILIDNYNNGPWLRACVDSALDQTRPADEVIVYDDGSNDDSRAILRSYGDRIRLIEGNHDHTKSGVENQGAAIHRGFLASASDHLYLLDGDDLYLPDHLERYETLWRESPRHVMLNGSMLAIDVHGQTLGSLYRSDRDHLDYRRAIYRHHDPDCFYPTSSLAFLREFLVRQLPLDFSKAPGLAPDARLSFAAVFTGAIGFVPEDTAIFRIRPGSLSDQTGLRSANRFRDSLQRIRHFNACAESLGQPKISPWLNRTVWKQAPRRILPEWIVAPFLRRKMRRYWQARARQTTR
jgi:glycosyltransferase involved in cell wall biosynthesis